MIKINNETCASFFSFVHGKNDFTERSKIKN